MKKLKMMTSLQDLASPVEPTWGRCRSVYHYAPSSCSPGLLRLTLSLLVLYLLSTTSVDIRHPFVDEPSANVK